MKHIKSITAIFLFFLFIVQHADAQIKRELINNIPVEKKYLELEKAASPALQQKLAQLRREGIEKKWTFQVVATTVATANIKDLTGAIPPAKTPLSAGSSPNSQPPPVGKNIGDAKARSFDSRSLDIISPVQNQNPCGSCWAFTTIACVETAHLLKNKLNPSFLDLSEQQILDCSRSGGCGGGNTADALIYLKTNFVVNEATYPYQASAAVCMRKSPTSFKIDNWGWVSDLIPAKPNQSEIKAAIVKFGSVASYMWANENFLMYGKGVYNDNSRKPESGYEGGHMVQIIGWNDDLGAWLIKNSWSRGWGQGGFGWIDYDVLDIGTYGMWTVANSITPVYKTITLPQIGKKSIVGHFSWSELYMKYPQGLPCDQVFEITVKAPRSKSGMYVDDVPLSSTQETYSSPEKISVHVRFEEPDIVREFNNQSVSRRSTLAIFTIFNLPENIPLTFEADILKQVFTPGTKALLDRKPMENESAFHVIIEEDPKRSENSSLAYNVNHSFADASKFTEKVKRQAQVQKTSLKKAAQ